MLRSSDLELKLEKNFYKTRSDEDSVKSKYVICIIVGIRVGQQIFSHMKYVMNRSQYRKYVVTWF